MRRLLRLLLGALAGLLAAAWVTKRLRPSRGDEQSDELELVTILGQVELHSRAAAFGGGSILTWFGVTVLDLTDAAPAAQMTLEVTSLLGVTVVNTPPGWRVRSTRQGVGTVVVNLPEPDDADAPTLTLAAWVLAGVVVCDATLREVEEAATA